MNWKNVRLIWFREIRDQLRDRRTLFTIAVLPLVLYPLMGMAMLQVTQFLRAHPVRVLLVGADFLPAQPALLEGVHFRGDYCPDVDRQLIEITPAGGSSGVADAAPGIEQAREWIESRRFDAILVIPAGFAEALQAYRSRLGEEDGRLADAGGVSPGIPEPTLILSGASDRSRVAADRIERVLYAYRSDIVADLLASRLVPAEAVQPFGCAQTDVAEDVRRRAALWSKILPLIVMVWALTGAFYPAIDLCAGEKERGTLETLLSSPALRSEIVAGKLLTVMTFSGATALLNLASMGATGAFIFGRLEQASEMPIRIGPPPWSALLWLILATPPVAALFSALSLAIAAFARSSKEGQYYLMPLLLVSLPLMILPILPAVELDLGTSLIPITGLMLWLRNVIEGQHAAALRYALPVLGVTAGGCWLAIRWAVQQFESESVLFRESERFSVSLWLRHKLRSRGDTPTAGDALVCSLLVLMITFFAGLRAVPPGDWAGLVRLALVTQVLFIAAPALLLSLVLTRSPRSTLRLRLPPVWTLPAAAALAAALHPLAVELALVIESLYPIGGDTLDKLRTLTSLLGDAPWWSHVLLLAMAPAICEELAFRGFILSGFRKLGSPLAAVAITSMFFGISHGLLQQSLSASAVGLVLGGLALQTRSIFPCMVYHLVHNALGISLGAMAAAASRTPALAWVFRGTESGTVPCAYSWPAVLIGAVLSALLLALLFRVGGNRPQPRSGDST